MAILGQPLPQDLEPMHDGVSDRAKVDCITASNDERENAHHKARIPKIDHEVIRRRSSSYLFAPKLVSVSAVDGAVLLAFQ